MSQRKASFKGSPAEESGALSGPNIFMEDKSAEIPETLHWLRIGPPLPKGSKYPNSRVLGPKIHALNGFWTLKPYYLGTWTLRARAINGWLNRVTGEPTTQRVDVLRV